MSQILRWALEVLILTIGIYLFLRYVRTTRGSRLIRGLLTTVTVGFVGLWAVSKTLDLEELSHLLHGSTGFILVAFVIVFQPELRRGIAQLGGTSLLGRWMNQDSSDNLRRVVRAARSMASRRCGALIAFERDTSLAGAVESGTEIDAAATARLIEALFHPGSPLHDGGVVIRRNRVAEAGCIFPLPQQGDIDPRLGTRHRAAMGLTEDTDAVVLVVSEETGAISIAHRGQLRTVISSEEVEEELRRIVEDGESGAIVTGEKRRGGGGGFLRDLVWLPASLLLAAGILYVAHQDIRVTKEFTVAVVEGAADATPRPRAGELLVLLPDAETQLLGNVMRKRIVASGTRAQLEDLGQDLGGTFSVPREAGTELALLLDNVSWTRPVLGVSYAWAEDDAPLLRLGSFETSRVPLTPETLTVDAARLDERYEISSEVGFEPEPAVSLRGPTDHGRGLRELLQPIVLGPQDRRDVRQRLRLTEEALANGFALENEVQVIVPIGPARRDAGTLTKEIAIIALDPAWTAELGRWSLPAHVQTARFRIDTAGLVPAGSDPASPAYRERIQAIRRYVEENLLVYVDLSEMPPEGEGQSLEVRFHLREKDWREALSLGGPDDEPFDRESIVVTLESAKTIRLERRPDPDPPN